MNVLYRIYTEDKNRGDVIDYVSKLFDNFTTYNGVGYWRGQAESCLVIEIIKPGMNMNSIIQIAEWIKTHNNQESVVVVSDLVAVTVVGEQL